MFLYLFYALSLSLSCLLSQLLIPEETPISDDIDFNCLSQQEMSGGNIKSAIFRAAARAALRTGKDHLLKMSDLEEAMEEERGKSSTMTSFRRQDSITSGMYN